MFMDTRRNRQMTGTVAVVTAACASIVSVLFRVVTTVLNFSLWVVTVRVVLGELIVVDFRSI